MPQASASFRLFVKPACEHDLSAGSRNVASANARRSGGGPSSGCAARACSSATCSPVSRTNRTQRTSATRATMAPPATSTSRAAYSDASQPLTIAAKATPPYPADSFSPSASPRRSGPTRSIFMTSVIDQASPWFTPSSALAATTQPQFGATAISSGTGSASAQPRMSSRRRPSGSANAPAPRLVRAFARPKATMNESTATLDPRPKSCSPISGRVERSSPTIAPTNALTATSSENCARFSRRPSWTVREPLEDGLTGLFLRLLLDVYEDRDADDVGWHPSTPRCVAKARPWSISGLGRRRQLGLVGNRASSPVGRDDLGLLRGRRWDVLHECLGEGVLGVELERLVVAALEPDRRGGIGRQSAAADRAGVVRRVEQQVIRQAEQPLGERAVQRPRHRLHGHGAVRVQVWPARVADQERIAGQHEP